MLTEQEGIMASDGQSDSELEVEPVGYMRPPRQHQFRKGQKPPPRKKREMGREDAHELFWRVLQEPRRVLIDGKPVWASATELIVRLAYSEAEKGSPTLQRLVNQMLLEDDSPAAQEMPEIIVEPDHPEPETFTVEVPAGYQYINGCIKPK
jgi:hypothetical protein